MHKYTGIVLAMLLSSAAWGQQNKIKKLNSGNWTGKLAINQDFSIPFQFNIAKNDNKYTFTVINGEEKIELDQAIVSADSLHITFKEYPTELVLKRKNATTLSGFWINRIKGTNYTLPCTLNYGYEHRFDSKKLYISTTQSKNFNGKWEVTFDQDSKDAYKAIGIFNQQVNKLSGTFLTETGDYRYLDGNVIGDSMYLSAFDGSHAYLFTGKLNNGIIDGHFYSGKHFTGLWTAVNNPNFELRNADSLTFAKEQQLPFSFDVENLDGSPYHFPNSTTQNKVIIVQIMGTWCPNCMDETRYFKELYTKYHAQGLEIVSIGYEYGKTFDERVAKIKMLQQRLQLDFIFLAGNELNKKTASAQFSMLNSIMSFPTTVIIGKDGLVKRVHTGFSGPGTGQYFSDYKLETETLLEELLKH